MGLVVIDARLTQAWVGVVVGERGDIESVEIGVFFFFLGWGVIAGLYLNEGGIGLA